MQCPYHGWEYNRGGECTKMPSTAFCSGVRVSALPCHEKDGGCPHQDMRDHLCAACNLPCPRVRNSVNSPTAHRYEVHSPVCAGLVWVWPGIGEAPEVPTFSPPPRGYTIHSEIEVSTSCCAGALLHSCAARVGLHRVPSSERGHQCGFCHQVEVPVEHGLLMENLLDLAHAPFTHTSTFAKGWPIPDSVGAVS